MKLLIVEDDDQILDMLKVLIKPEFEVHYAFDFTGAENYLKENTPDIVVTDFNFPGGDGNMVARLAKQVGCKKVLLHSSEVRPVVEKSLFSMALDKCEFTKMMKFLEEK